MKQHEGTMDVSRGGVDLRERRVRERAPVELWVDECVDGAVYFQRATNLSMGGCFSIVRCPTRRAPGWS